MYPLIFKFYYMYSYEYLIPMNVNETPEIMCIYMHVLNRVSWEVRVLTCLVSVEQNGLGFEDQYDVLGVRSLH